MKKLHQFLGYDTPKAGDFGIEIEVEGANLPLVTTGGWKSEKDGSLRGESYEYIFTNPVNRDKVRKNLDFLKHKLRDSKLDFSFRTSVHVHMNMHNCTHTQLLNTIYTYLLLEEPFLSYCGKERKGNRFCLRLQDAEGLLDILNTMFKTDFNSLMIIRPDAVRYAAINLESLTKYGSLEFRAMRGNLDVDVIDNWVEALYRVRAFAMQIENPIEIHNLYAEGSTQSFMETVLGDLSKTFYYPKMVRDIQKSFSLSLDLPYCFKNRIERVNEKKPEIKQNPVGKYPVYDFNFTRIEIGDKVEIVRKIEDGVVYWPVEMDDYVNNGEVYEVADIRYDPVHIILEGAEFVFPAEALSVVAKAGQGIEEEEEEEEEE